MCIIVSVRAITSTLHPGPDSLGQSEARILVRWPIRGQHHPLPASWALHTLLFIINADEAVAWQQTKIYSALISWISTGQGWRNKPEILIGKTHLVTFLLWNELEQCKFDNWQGVMHKWTLNLNLHPSPLSVRMGVSKLQPQNASLPLNSKIGNLTQIDILLVPVIFSAMFPSSHPDQPSLAHKWLVMIFTSWLYFSSPPQRVLNHPPGPNSITPPSLSPGCLIL